MISIYDPKPTIHDYLSPMYFQPMRDYAFRNGIPLSDLVVLTDLKDSTICINADYLNPEVISLLKSNRNKIVGFSVTDSSWVSQHCRSGKDLQNIDLMFMLTGIQKVNTGKEFIIDRDFNVVLEDRQFLPEEDWNVFHSMHQSGRLQSLPYVHAERQADVPAQPYNSRSQKALIRGGHHMRRFLLALHLMNIDRLDTNSGFVTSPYFKDDMNPQFRYCDQCRLARKKHDMYPKSCVAEERPNCQNEMWRRNGQYDLSNLGAWNNKCPHSFYSVADEFGAPLNQVEKLLNANWLPQRSHLEMLARITFTSDLKWLFSIYAAQRFWDAASVGCINFLPRRTADQDYFPVMSPDVHYMTFEEDFNTLSTDMILDEKMYNNMSSAAKALYSDWMKPSEFAINTNLLRHIFIKIKQFTS